MQRAWRYLAIIGLILVVPGSIAISLILTLKNAYPREQKRLQEDIAAIRRETLTRPPLFGPTKEGNAWDHYKRSSSILNALAETNPRLFADPAKLSAELADLALMTNFNDALDEFRRGLCCTTYIPSHDYNKGIQGMIGISYHGKEIVLNYCKLLQSKGERRKALDLIVLALGVTRDCAWKAAFGYTYTSFQYLELLEGLLGGNKLDVADLNWLRQKLIKLGDLNFEAPSTSVNSILNRAAYLQYAIDPKPLLDLLGFSPHGKLEWHHFGSTRLASVKAIGHSDQFHLDMDSLKGLPFSKSDRAKLREMMKVQLESENPVVTNLAFHTRFVDYEASWECEAAQRVMLGMARIAVAIAEFKSEHGEFPADLASLVPKYLPTIPLDGFNGLRPLRYVLKGGSALVYSFGGDEDDDNAKAVSKEQGWGRCGNAPHSPDRRPFLHEDGDIVWTIAP